MTLLQYYLYANIYILAFWICYRICLKNLVYFKSVRIYLNSAVVLSAILPLLQTGIADLIGSTSMVTAGQDLPLVGIIYQYQQGETLSATTTSSISRSGIIKTIMISGSMFTALIYIYNHLRIISVLRRSTEYLRLENGLKAMRSNEVTVPFIYINRIVIPGDISDKEISQVMAHEMMHHHNAHHFDNMLFSLLHMVFWANPFFLLIRSALKLNHEFQVDDQILSTGIDPVTYKFSLVKYSVGSKLFSLANGLSSTNTKNRLLMINNNHIKKGKWRLYLLVPIIGILFSVFCFAYIQPDPPSVPSEAPSIIAQEDSLVVEFIDHYPGKEGEEVVVWKSSVIVVLINKDSKIMVAREELPLQSAEQKIISEYNRMIENFNANSDKDSPEYQDSEIKIHVMKDTMADKDEYKKLVDAISNALLKLREWHSVQLFGSTFTSLSDTDKEAIAKLIPLRIYGTHPDNLNE
jgi:beta-lactamase regulating signal transducer with metallopeptidase domain